ncbi:DUF3558 domain-containing protein [Saccharothrix hoggarensis]|uniref:DUF3558 domain-containing protein n=1 Tax=Saccharothrix hoggarensis TaxID=913853 RepID=A0ABW3QTR4_9PSEU
MRRVVPLIAVLALLGGCSQTTDGSATPGDSGSTSTGRTSGSDEPTGSREPSGQPSEQQSKRPKTIDISALDPCTLLTDAQRAEFGMDRPPRLEDEADKPGCSLSREDRKFSIGIYLSRTQGIEVYTDPPRPGATTLEVGGFPAVMVEADTSLGLGCSMILDVADGKSVDVIAHSLGDTDVKGLCQVVQPIAGAVMANLNK